MTPADHYAAAEQLLTAAADRTRAATVGELHTQRILADRALTEHDLAAALVHAVLAAAPHPTTIERTIP